jgi:two-component system OmpR family response regulator
MAHVLVVDDDIRLAHSLQDYLHRKGYRTTIATSGLDALDQVVKVKPDVLVLDVNLPGMNGLEVCRKLRAYPIHSDIPVLFASARDSASDRIAGLEAGGDDYISKPFDVREVELRVQALLRRSGAAMGLVEHLEMAVGDLKLDKRTFRARVGKREVQLTPVEYELLRYLMLRAGEVVSSEQLLQEVWRYYPGTGDAAVVRVQIMNLRDKIEHDRKRPAYIQTVYRHGYMVSAPNAAAA